MNQQVCDNWIKIFLNDEIFFFTFTRQSIVFVVHVPWPFACLFSSIPSLMTEYWALIHRNNHAMRDFLMFFEMLSIHVSMGLLVEDFLNSIQSLSHLHHCRHTLYHYQRQQTLPQSMFVIRFRIFSVEIINLI